MRTPVKIVVIVGVLLLAVCAVGALLFARDTEMRLDHLEYGLNGRRSTNDSKFVDQQEQIDDLARKLCKADPTTCGPS